MDTPILSFDVSKDESHAQAFVSMGQSYLKPIRFRHDVDGFAKAEELYAKLEKKTGAKPAVVYEFTGVYAFPLLAFFLQKGWTIYQVSPLESAKERKSNIRPTKNDWIDCVNIQTVFYRHEHCENRRKPLVPYKPEDKVYQDLREMMSYYEYENKELTKVKNRYQRCLDAVWPCFSEDLIAYDSDAGLKIVSHFGHPDFLKTEKGILSQLDEIMMGKAGKRSSLARKLEIYKQTHISGCDSDSFMVDELKELAKELTMAAKKKNATVQKMVAKCESLPQYNLLLTIPGVAEKTAAKAVAGIGDIDRFHSAKSLVAYIGCDPDVNQSGKKDGMHLPITKKGNKYLRSALYLIVGNMKRADKDGPISAFVEKKKKDGLCAKAARIAAVAKLTRIIYGMLSTGCVYSPNDQEGKA